MWCIAVAGKCSPVILSNLNISIALVGGYCFYSNAVKMHSGVHSPSIAPDADCTPPLLRTAGCGGRSVAHMMPVLHHFIQPYLQALQHKTKPNLGYSLYSLVFSVCYRTGKPLSFYRIAGFCIKWRWRSNVGQRLLCRPAKLRIILLWRLTHKY